MGSEMFAKVRCKLLAKINILYAKELKWIRNRIRKIWIFVYIFLYISRYKTNSMNAEKSQAK